MRFLDAFCSRLMTLSAPQETVAPVMPEDPRIRALCRPSNYGDMNPVQRRAIDRELDLVGWDGGVS